MRESTTREKLAKLRAKLRMGEQIFPSEIDAVMPAGDQEQNLSKEEKELWLKLLILSKAQDKEEEMDMTISSIMDMYGESGDEKIFKGDADTVFIITDSFLNLGKGHGQLVYRIEGNKCYLHFGPLSFQISAPGQKVKEIWDMLVSVFSLSAAFTTEEEEVWEVVIKDKSGNSFVFSGSNLFPFFPFPHFTFDTLPDFLELPETNGRDCFKNISFLYSRLEKEGKGKVLEKLFLDMEEGIAEIEKQSNKENISYKKSGEAKVIGKAFSQIDVYSFYPKSWNKDISPINSDETKDEEYRRTKYFFSGKTKYGREIKWEGYFTALTLPLPWHDASISIRRNFPFATFLESTEPSMIDMPPTCKDTIYVAGVVFSDKEYEKEYSYISPFGLLRPGTEVTVPVGGKNVPRSATVKSIKAYNKRDEISLKGLKEIITSSDL